MFFKKTPRTSYGVGYDEIHPIRHFDIDPEVESERLISLKYLINEIKRKNLEGDIAEAGVMCGYFAKYLNQGLPNKQLHLFDTFNGFKKDELEYDKKNYLTNKHDYKMFDCAPLEKVQSILPMAHYHIGYFNDTKDEVDNSTFCLVSLDMDLFIPTYQGLEFFYPRLNNGGYILLHDYNHPDDFYGVKSAVYKYEKEYEPLNIVPLPDYSGTVVIVK